MTKPANRPPKGGFAAMLVELHVNNFERSFQFWTGPLGFTVAYARGNANFAFLERPEGAQVMLCQRHGGYETGPMTPPLGQGVMLQIYVEGLQQILDAFATLNHPLYQEPREVWRNWGDREGGQREAFVQDPDGYLIMIAERLGERPLT